jgi:adenylate cyclase
MVVLTKKVPLRYTILEGRHIGVKNLEGFVVGLSEKGAEIVLGKPVEQFSDLKMNLKDVYEEQSVKAFYGKVTDRSGRDAYTYRIRFTSVPLEVTAYFLAHQQYAAKHRL